MPHSQHQYQQQQLQSSRSLLQSQLQAQSHVNLGAVSSANISQQHAFGLAHLSELMTGGLMVSKQPPTPGAHPNGHSNRSQLPGVSSHDMFQHHAPSTFMALQQQQQQPQPSSSHSNQDPFSYDQTTASLYCTPQDQHEQQQRHAAFLMSRGPSSSSTCSTSSSTTLHDVLSGGSGGSTGGSSSNGSVNGCGNSNSSNSNQHGHNQTAFNAMTVMGGAKPMISTSVAAMMGPMNPVQTSGVAAIEKVSAWVAREVKVRGP
ncbi:hypothetical protein EDD11_005983 [Mortierella claussenii]|nr:hypothetical protein EDD11_005983 [Mortierella claussenii]